MTILVTGAYGFIGSNFVKHLNKNGITDIIVCDFLTNGKQFTNLSNCKYEDLVTPYNITNDFLKNKISKVFHFGAISNTNEWNGELVLERNYNYTIDIIKKCIENKVFISYSSSASVYGNDNKPLNLYAYSKLLIDNYVNKQLVTTPTAGIQGFRYFNVYAQDDSEWHKGDQASPYYKFKHQALNTGEIKIFEGSENFKRDFVHVEQVCKIQYMCSLKMINGIFDLGSGKQLSFLNVAEQLAKEHNAKVVTIPFPEHLKNHYQTNTMADMQWLERI